MVLRKLSIFGFKSFAEKIELRFGDGMTAVIGPNGCGKSNVVDAIRWVFGEQRASVLRGSNMQDVIFSGSQRRQPLNMAEVTLTIANTKGILPIEYNEVAISRRIYRSGESEYLINKTQSRLKDIHGLFLDTGIGSTAYTTIENAMINNILSDKTEERRILFEEAAGIGKYKHRIKESQRKLDRTRQDLLRINDRVQEKDRYVRMLGRQVEKAKRYKQYHEDLKSLEVGFENARYQSLKEALAVRKNEITALEDTIETLRAQIACAESNVEKLQMEKMEKENELQIAGRNVSDASERINSVDRELSVSKQSLSYLKQNVGRFDQEIKTLEEESTAKNELRTNLEKSIIAKETQLQEYYQKVEDAKAELESFSAQYSSKRQLMEELSAQLIDFIHKSGDRQKQLSNCQTNLSNCIEKCERGESEIEKLKVRLEENGEVVENCKRQLEKVSSAFKNHMQTREKLLTRIDQEEDRYHTFVEKEKRLEAHIDASKSKLRFLKGLDASFEGYAQGVKALLKSNIEGIAGIVADCIDVTDSSMIEIIERALGSSIQTVVFNTDAALKNAVDYLNTDSLGTARMISLESLGVMHSAEVASQIDGMDVLRRYIKTNDEYTALADHFFNTILVCDTKDTAFDHQQTIGKEQLIVSRDGVLCYGNRAVVAGTKNKEQGGILQRKKEIERLDAEIIKCEKELSTVIHDKEVSIITRDEAKQALVEVDEKLNTSRQVQQEQETTIKHYEAENENIKDRIRNLSDELSLEYDAKVKYTQLIQEHEQALHTMNEEKTEHQSKIDRLKELLSEMASQQMEYSDHQKNVELAWHGVKNAIQQDKHSIAALKKDIENYNTNRQRKIEDKNNAAAEIKNIEERLIVLKESMDRHVAQRQDLQQKYETIRESFNGILFSIDEVRKEIKVLQHDYESASNQKHALDVSQTRDSEQQRSIREKIFNTYEIDLESPSEEIPMIDQEDASITDQIHMFKERLRRVGEVNMGAIKEYETESEELKQMVFQRDDLQTAVDELERAIKKLNREARVQFTTTFEQVQKNFQEMFSTLFEGGEAYLTLQEDVDPLEAEIRINARPAGKKMRSVSLLSGGERAMTAISLLFALYMVKPSAYCILDELDAPLDDANIGRFVRLLKRFSDKTQFIVITHNKHTMEAADILYGVTQQESGVSTIASVQIEEIFQTQQAA